MASDVRNELSRNEDLCHIPERVLDVRCKEDFDSGHLRNALHIEFEELSSRFAELPPRDVSFSVIVNAAAKSSCEDLLYQKGWKSANFIEVPSPEWNKIEHLLTAEPNPYVPLFRPCKLLEEVISTIEDDLRENNEEAKGKVLDLGCGQGRDVVYLCLRSGFHWEVTAVDMLSKMLDRVQHLASKANVMDKITLAQCRCRGDGLAVFQDDSRETIVAYDKLPLFQCKYSLVVVVRFLERTLLSALAESVAPGGWILYRQFQEGVEKSAVGHPKNPHRILRIGELTELFGGKGFDVKIDRTDILPDGRPMNSFLARKRSLPKKRKLSDVVDCMKDVKRVKTKWDNYWESNILPPWDSASPCGILVDALAEEDFLKPRNGARALELGCGSGQSSVYMAEQGFHVVAVDIAKRALEIGSDLAQDRKVSDKIEWMRCDIFSLVEDNILEPKSFDFIFDLQCFHAIRNQNQAKLVLIISALLRQGGYALIVTGNANEPKERGPSRLREEEIREAFDGSGLELVWIREGRFDPTPAYEKSDELPPLAWKCLFKKT